MDIEFNILRTQCKIKFTYHSECFSKNVTHRRIILIWLQFFFFTGDAYWLKMKDNFLDILTLEGAGRQIVDTRSIFGLLLTNSGSN